MMATDTKPTQEQIAQLTESANLQYGLKNYDAAAELYSRASEAQSELNGDMAPENADLLYLYGRCLYKVAVSNSDVLGSKVAGEEKQKKTSKGESSKQAGASSSTNATGALPTKDEKLAEEVVEAAVEAKDGTKPVEEKKLADKPYFQITGDENWDTDSDEQGEGEDGEGAEEAEDDMQNAYEILDLARVILKHKLDELAGVTKTSDEAADKGKGKAVDYPGDVSDLEVRTTKEKLADILDLQADISLESERFVDAIPDNRATLALRNEYLPKESALIAESHYKLSLALEFASMTAVKEAQDANGDGEVKQQEPPQVDMEMRAEAAKEMEHAIDSCRLRIKKEEESIGSLEGSEKDTKSKEVKEVKEILEEMEQRLVDLRASPVEIPNISGPAGATDADPLGGLLGSILGESHAEAKARIEEASKSANVLTGLVRTKKATAPPAAAASLSSAPPQTNGNGKRKMDDEEPAPETKKTKVEVEDLLN